MVTPNEKEILRRLAAEYMEAALLPVQREKLNLWKALNRSEMQRPMVVIDQLPWHELEPRDSFLTAQVTSDPYWRDIENRLRMTLYQWKHFPVDMVLEPYIRIPNSAIFSGYGVAAEKEVISHSEGDTAMSQHFIPQIRTMEDIQKIKDQTVILNEEDTKRHLAEAEEIFAGIAPVKMSNGIANSFDYSLHLGVWDVLTELMGVENIYMDFIDRPEFLHAAMRRITDSVLSGIRAANELNLHSDDTNKVHCSYIYTDELLPDFGAGKGSVSKNCWAFGLAQLFTSVSPAFMEEFEFPYISEMAKEFGMVYYGCCDRLDDRLDMVKRIPNVRKVSCSPWSGREAFAEKIGASIIMSNKPTPAFLAGTSMDEDAVRSDLKRTYDAAKRNGVNLEFILKDISTVSCDPQRLTRWAEIAMEVVQG